MIKRLLETSLFMAPAMIISRRYRSIVIFLSNSYRNSSTHAQVVNIFNCCFRPEDPRIARAVSESMILPLLTGAYEELKYKLTLWMKKSTACDLLCLLRERFGFLSLRAMGQAMAIAILINITLYILLKKDTGLIWWLIRLPVLLIGSGSLLSGFAYEDLKKGSLTVRYLNNYYGGRLSR